MKCHILLSFFTLFNFKVILVFLKHSRLWDSLKLFRSKFHNFATLIRKQLDTKLFEATGTLKRNESLLESTTIRLSLKKQKITKLQKRRLECLHLTILKHSTSSVTRRRRCLRVLSSRKDCVYPSGLNVGKFKEINFFLYFHLCIPSRGRVPKFFRDTVGRSRGERG